MAIPLFVGAGTGVTVTGASGTVSKTSCIAGNFIVVQYAVNGTGQNGSLGTITNIEDVTGTDNAMTLAPNGPYGMGSPSTGVHVLYYGRVMANGTCSADINIVTNDFVARMYEFSGVSTDSTLVNIVDNTAGGPMRQKVATSTTVSTQDPSLTTTGPDRLGTTFVAINGNVATGNFSGEVGGDWVEAVAEYSDTVGTIQLQTAQMAVAGSITGTSTMTISASSGWATETIAFVPAPAPAVTASIAWLRA